MGLAFLVLLFSLVALLTLHVLRRVQGNYLLSIFPFLFSFFALYGYVLYSAQSAIIEFHGTDVLPVCWCVILIGLAGIAIGYRVFPISSVRRSPHLRAPVRIDRLAVVGMLLMTAGIAGEIVFI